MVDMVKIPFDSACRFYTGVVDMLGTETSQQNKLLNHKLAGKFEEIRPLLASGQCNTPTSDLGNAKSDDNGRALEVLQNTLPNWTKTICNAVMPAGGTPDAIQQDLNAQVMQKFMEVAEKSNFPMNVLFPLPGQEDSPEIFIDNKNKMTNNPLKYLAQMATDSMQEVTGNSPGTKVLLARAEMQQHLNSDQKAHYKVPRRQP